MRFVTAAILTGLTFFLFSASAFGRYPRLAGDSQGTWIATDEALIRVVGDLFTFYTSANGLPGDRVRNVAPDDREVWVATPRGLGRMDRNSRRWETFHAPDPLPSDNVYSVAVDDRFAWVGTAKGIVRWDKLAKKFEPFGRQRGTKDLAIFDILSFGKTVWFASQKGLLRFGRQTGEWQYYGPQEGLDIGAVLEIMRVGESLWLLGHDGIARFDLRSEAISTFKKSDGLPSNLVTAFAPVAGETWIGTDKGIVVYKPGSDAISPFLYGKGMPPGQVVGIQVSMPWVWVATSKGLGLFNTRTKVWEEKRTEDGLAQGPILGMSMAGSMLVLLQDKTFQGYQTQREDWVTYPIEDIWEGKTSGAGDSSSVRVNFELIASGDGNLTWTGDDFAHTEQIVPDMRLGAGASLDEGRSIDTSVRLDFGDATQSGIREYDAEFRFRGNDKDTLRELILSDELRLKDSEDQHDLVDDAWLEGIGVYQHMGASDSRKTDPITVDTEVGLRRGVRVREYFRGSIDYTYQLGHQYITARSDVVKVDGQILDRDVDYIITHTTGQLTFLNPDKVNALSLIEVTYTYEQVPRKDTASTSILEMLPWDKEIGGFARSSSPVYVSDETGLYKKIDGGAPKYLDRGWMESVFQDYVQGSTSLSIQINDMGSPQNAQEIFDYDKPISYVVLWDEPDTTAVLDESLASSYAVKMRMDKYYVELSIDEKSKSAEILIDLFAQAVRTKGDLSGTSLDRYRSLGGRVRLGVNPSDHFGMGMGALFGSDLENDQVSLTTGLSRRSFGLGTIDLWTSHKVGSGAWGGDLSSFAQFGYGRSSDTGAEDVAGRAFAGNLIYNSQALTLRLDGEAQSRDYESGTSRDTPLGTFAGDVRADATFNPVRWLRLRLLYDHERSFLSPDLSQDPDGTGINENLMGKLTFKRAKWPTVWLLAGRSVLEGGEHKDEKLRLAGSLEYDLAHGILQDLGLKKLAVKAYFDMSSNQVPILIDEHNPILEPSARKKWIALGSNPGQAQNMRFELKFAPTSTEDAYARFERKTFEPNEGTNAGSDTDTAALPLEYWELIMGAASRWLPGIVPTFNGKMTYKEGKDQNGDYFQDAQSILSGQMEFFPGQWISSLGSTLLSVGYGFTNSEQADGMGGSGNDLIWSKAMHLVKHQVEAKGSYGNYDDVFRMESRTKWWTVREGETQAETEQYFELLNRLTFRPVYTSPLTLRLDYAQLEQINPSDSQMGSVKSFAPSLEWEKRWSQDLVTKLRLEVPWRTLSHAWDDIRQIDRDFQEWSIKPWFEVRWRLREVSGDSQLRLALRAYNQWIRPFSLSKDGNSGAETARELYAAVWLDWERPGSFLLRIGAVYLWHVCESLDLVDEVAAQRECMDSHSIQPTLKAIARF